MVHVFKQNTIKTDFMLIFLILLSGIIQHTIEIPYPPTSISLNIYLSTCDCLPLALDLSSRRTINRIQNTPLCIFFSFNTKLNGIFSPWRWLVRKFSNKTPLNTCVCSWSELRMMINDRHDRYFSIFAFILSTCQREDAYFNY